MRAQIYYNFLFVNAFILSKITNLQTLSKGLYDSTRIFYCHCINTYFVF